MMSKPDVLADFIKGLPAKLAPGEFLELVLAGDVIDFLAIELDGRTDPWTANPDHACAKLLSALERDRSVYEALADHLAQGHGLTILVGNHDVELALPIVQRELCKALRCRPGAVHFVDDGRAWRYGEVLVEHGNRYDPANENDWDSLREIASCQSRGEQTMSRLRPSEGSKIVHRVVQEHKNVFEFIDTLQPQGAIVAYLMAALDPSLLDRLPALARVMYGRWLSTRNAAGLPPKRRAARGVGDDDVDIENLALEALLGEVPKATRGPLLDVLRESLKPTDKSLLHMIVNRIEIPDDRLAKIQKVLVHMLKDDRSLDPQGPADQFGKAAARLRDATGARVVVMGHTHQARHIGPPDMAEYINTGTWADLVTVPEAALKPDSAGLAALQTWIVDLALDTNLRTVVPTWAEIRVDAEGRLLSAHLEPRPEPLATPQT
ncbi:hypothetical protein OV079_02765 [Nannocystis pusilla]|uniref:Calcineurin-like phosphoesterase domain-containing protein n=1 Tax=Nannocystis pusilla TaxID=889268 RepID=A0A9X3EI71_9BACT|nr:hypothetical protein [Nannocystis pusilla]MCY1004507.1 hypothetical protein [Nannocystis pusilla]